MHMCMPRPHYGVLIVHGQGDTSLRLIGSRGLENGSVRLKVCPSDGCLHLFVDVCVCVFVFVCVYWCWDVGGARVEDGKSFAGNTS